MLFFGLLKALCGVFGLMSSGGLLNDAGGLAEDMQLSEWWGELGALDVFVGYPYRLEDGLAYEASLRWCGAQVEVVEVVVEDCQHECERVLDRLVADAQALEDGGGVETFALDADGLLAEFYVSATTITTLGLGDISPVSSTARLLIWMEALLGIVFIGLFLNDLARVWRGRAS